ncbi:MAG: hypothetical protein GY944_09015 [bacterium]|nr:hypothetical protein [bacterium]
MRWRAKRQLNLRSVNDARIGAITFVQRADSALRLNVHFHTLALDGVYVRDEERRLQFCMLSEPRAEDVAQVAAWTHASLLRVLERHGRSLEGVSDAPDAFADDQPVLASCYGASAADLQLLGSSAGQRTDKLARPLRLIPTTGPGALAEVGGVNIHAQVALDGRDRRSAAISRDPSLTRAARATSGRTSSDPLQERLEGWHARRVARAPRLHQPALRTHSAAAVSHVALPRRPRRSLQRPRRRHCAARG